MKKIRNTGLLLAALLFFACEKKVEQPTLSDEKISRIMADFATAEAATNGLNGFPKDSLLQLYFGQVLELHQITREEYEKNLRLLTNDLPRMQAIIKAAELLMVPEEKKTDVEK